MSTELDKARLLLATRAADLAAVRKVWPSAYAAASDALDALAVALAEVDRLTAALAEAEATIANERGEGEPPEPGWAFCDPWPEAAWVADFGAEFRLWCNGDLVVKRTDRRSPSWRTFRRPQEGWGAVAFGPSYPTARAAMRAATLKETP